MSHGGGRRAESELQNDDQDAVISETSLEVIKSNTTTPMIVYSHKDSVHTERNINNTNLDNFTPVRNLNVDTNYKNSNVNAVFAHSQFPDFGCPSANENAYFDNTLLLQS